MSSSVSVTDTSENHYDSGSDSDDDEEDQKSTAESRFSYFLGWCCQHLFALFASWKFRWQQNL